MALEFKSVTLDLTRVRPSIPEKVVVLVNVSSVMPCEMLQVWWFVIQVEPRRLWALPRLRSGVR
ncbi:hypothetical protein HanIR_Chr04g0154941 [Helianthus annuus]|nr:hypothetical protein HanIR_Chr04g0154941 [Helianthus annuus]